MFLPDPPPPRAPAGLKLPVGIIGGGITGLTAAYTLARQNIAVRLFEANTRAGGVIHSERDAGGWLIESGPNTLHLNSKPVADLLQQLGLDSKQVAADPRAKKRYIVRDGKPIPLPASPGQFLSTPLLSLSAKMGLVGDLFMRPKERMQDVSLAELVDDHFGAEVVRYGLDPMVSGVYAGNPAQLSARHAFPSLWEAERSHGSLLRGLLAQARQRKEQGHPKSTLLSFVDGMETLPSALAAGIPGGAIELSAKVTFVQPGRLGAPSTLRWTRDGAEFHEPVSAVILALPPHAAASLPIGTLGQYPLRTLRGMVMPAVTSLFLGFRREQVKHPLDGFGMLIPAAEGSPLLGALFSSTLFPGRAPDGHVALTLMIGGARRADLPGLPDDELFQKVLPELDRLLKIKGDPVFVRRNTWAHAIPQYDLGHEEHLEAISRVEQTWDSLLIGGPVCNGISVPQCILAGQRLAERVAPSQTT